MKLRSWLEPWIDRPRRAGVEDIPPAVERLVPPAWRQADMQSPPNRHRRLDPGGVFRPQPAAREDMHAMAAQPGQVEITAPSGMIRYRLRNGDWTPWRRHAGGLLRSHVPCTEVHWRAAGMEV